MSVGTRNREFGDDEPGPSKRTKRGADIFDLRKSIFGLKTKPPLHWRGGERYHGRLPIFDYTGRVGVVRHSSGRVQQDFDNINPMTFTGTIDEICQQLALFTYHGDTLLDVDTYLMVLGICVNVVSQDQQLVSRLSGINGLPASTLDVIRSSQGTITLIGLCFVLNCLSYDSEHSILPDEVFDQIYTALPQPPTDPSGDDNYFSWKLFSLWHELKSIIDAVQSAPIWNEQATEGAKDFVDSVLDATDPRLEASDDPYEGMLPAAQPYGGMSDDDDPERPESGQTPL